MFPEATEEEMEAGCRKILDVVHPLVRIHPEIGKRGLHLGGEWSSCIDGLETERAQALYDELLHHMIPDRFSYRHRWQPGDVPMSDNRCSMRRASEWDEDRYVRRLHRIIMIDDKRRLRARKRLAELGVTWATRGNITRFSNGPCSSIRSCRRNQRPCAEPQPNWRFSP